MLVVASNVPAHDMGELIALARKQPGKLNFASSGPGSLPHLAGELSSSPPESISCTCHIGARLRR